MVKNQQEKVYRLRKALYGLKQAPRAWNSKIDNHLLQSGFVKSPSKPSLYIKTEGPDFLILCLCVDDCIYTCSNQKMIEEFKKTTIDVRV